MEETRWFSVSSREALRRLGSSGEQGLSGAEAAARLQKFGFNELKEERKRTILEMFASQFANFLILLLLVAAVIAALLGEWIDAIVIGGILLLNAVLGTVQEFRAEKAIEMLRRMTSPTAVAVRDGATQVVQARKVVPGDIVLFEAGTIIPADCRLVESMMLATNEAPLTGESGVVAKDTDAVLPEKTMVAMRSNMVFTGTSVVRGRGAGLVIATGTNTEFGKIASAVQTVVAEETPLKVSIEKLGRQLAILVIVACAVIFVLGLMRGIPALEMFLTSVSLAVAAVPEGLPAAITIALALGVQRMAGKNAIVRKLLAVEALGSTNVICTDKTGTITKNEMTVREVYVAGEWLEVEGFGYDLKGRFLRKGREAGLEDTPGLRELLHVAALCNNATLVHGKDGSISALGDPTEAALLVLAAKGGVHRDELKKGGRFLREFPFDPERKMMSVVYSLKGDEELVLLKGAPEAVLARCSHYLANDGKRPLADRERSAMLGANARMAEKALRVLAFASRAVAKAPAEPKAAEKDLTFIGLAGMLDAPREGVPEAIELCRRAGIEVVMITGDNERTAKAIAGEIGLLRPGDIVINGVRLDGMDDKELSHSVEHIRVYARVSPEHKLRIINAWKSKGRIVAMTGDGVNDAVALKRSDIGVAMGITGTDVTKEVSDIVLADDNFVTIVSAVREGRGIYENIRKCIAYLLSGNIAEVLVIFTAVILGYPLPLAAVQILWVNLVTDGLPALALAADPIDENVMRRKPRERRESIWRGMRPFLFDYPLLFLAIGMLLFSTFLDQGLLKAQTVLFTFLIIFEKYQAFSCRNLEHPVGLGVFGNRWLILATLLTITLHMAILYTPALNDLFKVTPLSLGEWLLILGAGALAFIYLETVKAFSHPRTGR